jgi:riboflavin synthase
VFTGLVRAIGTLHPLSASSMRIECRAIAAALPHLALGDSVAVDGVCLTVTKILPQGFIADVSPETLDRTTLGQTQDKPLSYVNLEPSLQVGSKIGGHFVTGHIDGTGSLESASQTETAWEMCFQVSDARVARYIVPKGSVAVNGVSLTVADCTPTGDWFKAAVIPLTYRETNLRYLQPGSLVNLEGDVLGKYVEKFLRLGAGSAAIADLEILRSPSDDLTPTFLAEHGYL